jgi:hypothetical protein
MSWLSKAVGKAKRSTKRAVQRSGITHYTDLLKKSGLQRAYVSWWQTSFTTVGGAACNYADPTGTAGRYWTQIVNESAAKYGAEGSAGLFGRTDRDINRSLGKMVNEGSSMAFTQDLSAFCAEGTLTEEEAEVVGAGLGAETEEQSRAVLPRVMPIVLSQLQARNTGSVPTPVAANTVARSPKKRDWRKMKAELDNLVKQRNGTPLRWISPKDLRQVYTRWTKLGTENERVVHLVRSLLPPLKTRSGKRELTEPEAYGLKISVLLLHRHYYPKVERSTSGALWHVPNGVS